MTAVACPTNDLAVSTMDFKLGQEKGELSFAEKFIGYFVRYDDEEVAQKKLAKCLIFCTMMGLENSPHCKSIVKATCALSKCSFDVEEVEHVLGYALVNLNREYAYLTGLNARHRANIAVCHMYIAQAILFDDFATIRAFCLELYNTEDTLPFFDRVMDVMAAWKHRIQVSGAAMARVLELFVDLNES
jgi:hypothetical protein